MEALDNNKECQRIEFKANNGNTYEYQRRK